MINLKNKSEIMKQKMWLMLWFAGLLYLVRYCNTHGNTAHCQITFIFSKAMMRSFADTLHESVNIWHNHCDNLRKTISHSFKITPSLSSIGLSIWNVCDLIVRFLHYFYAHFTSKTFPNYSPLMPHQVISSPCDYGRGGGGIKPLYSNDETHALRDCKLYVDV